MQAMIFAAGLGTRFKPWTDKHPKALALVNGKSLLQRNIEYLQQYGIDEVIVNVHHFAGQVKDAVMKNKGWGSRVIFSDESHQLLETGGGLLKAKPLFTPEQPFLTCNADILTNLNIHNLLLFHQAHQPLITFAVTNRPTSRYLLLDEHNRLCGWKNVKTGMYRITSHTQGSRLIEKAYSTVVVFEYDVFRLMEEKGFRGAFSLIDVYLSLAPDHRVLGFDHSGDQLTDVGKPGSIEEAEQLFP